MISQCRAYRTWTRTPQGVTSVKVTTMATPEAYRVSCSRSRTCFVIILPLQNPILEIIDSYFKNMAGLLTCFRLRLPSRSSLGPVTSHSRDIASPLMKLTVAGLFRTLTGFPFNR